MNNILWDSSAEFMLALDDIAAKPKYQVPLSADEFFAEFLSSSEWDVVEMLEPDSVLCPHCGKPTTADGLGGRDCAECGTDVVG